MHEARLIRDLLSRIEQVARDEQADRVERVRIEIGAQSHVTPESLRAQFELHAHGSVAQAAALDFTRSNDQTAADSHDIRLVSLTVSDTEVGVAT
jgi:hydrogenase nickel incorporation protein HypA/HybF